MLTRFGVMDTTAVQPQDAAANEHNYPILAPYQSEKQYVLCVLAYASQESD